MATDFYGNLSGLLTSMAQAQDLLNQSQAVAAQAQANQRNFANAYLGTVTITTNATVNYDWPVWVEQTNALTQTETWVTWTGGTTGGTNIYMPPQVIYNPPAPNPAMEAAMAQAAADEAAAKKRARLLLLSFLTNAQQESLKKHKHFDIVGSRGRRYRIRDGSHGNVVQLDAAGKEQARYCGQPNGVPVGDMMLAQKLQIETDEDEYLRLANLMSGVRQAA